jgi:hypothetical protein
MAMPNPLRGLETARPPGAARWQAAEDRLYPLVMVDPALYEAALTLVREIADVLRAQCFTVGALVEADAAEVLARCPAAPAVAALGLDPGGVFDAARACRWRELTTDDIESQDGAR